MCFYRHGFKFLRKIYRYNRYGKTGFVVSIISPICVLNYSPIYCQTISSNNKNISIVQNNYSGIILAIVNILLPIYFGYLINAINTFPISYNCYLQNIQDPIKNLIFIYGLQAYLTFNHIYFLTKFGENVACKLRLRLYSTFLNKKLEFFDKKQVGDLVNRLSQDVNNLKSSMKKCVSVGIKSTCQTLGTIITLYQISPQMTLGVIFILPSLIAVGSFIAKGLRSISKECQDKLTKEVNIANETLTNIRTVKTFAVEEGETLKYENASKKYSESSEFLGIGIAVFQALSNLTLNFLILLTVGYGGSYLIASADGQGAPTMSAGDLMSFLLGVQNIQKCLSQISTLADSYTKYKVSRDRIYEYMSSQNIDPESEFHQHRWLGTRFDLYSSLTKLLQMVGRTINFDVWQCCSNSYLMDDTTKTNLPPLFHHRYLEGDNSDILHGRILPPLETLRGEVVFENISFAYPSRPDVKVIENFNLKIKPGQMVTICGHNGSGKTTLVSLLERFYEPTSGRITIDGIDIRQFDLKWLRRNLITVIDQEPILFSGTVIDNVKFGKPDASAKEIERVIKITKIDEFISSEEYLALEDGAQQSALSPSNLSFKLDSPSQTLAERGKNLSGGQKQRINIARAILKKSPIVILDEATSSMDPDSESKIKEALDDYLPGHTVISISHRLNTVSKSDLIVVMSKGKIIEQGSHDELYRNKGMYWELVQHSVIHHKN